MLQGVVGNERVRPHRLQQLFLGNSFPGVPGQAQQDLHHFRLQMSRRAVTGDAVQARLNQIGP